MTKTSNSNAIRPLRGVVAGVRHYGILIDTYLGFRGWFEHVVPDHVAEYMKGARS